MSAVTRGTQAGTIPCPPLPVRSPARITHMNNNPRIYLWIALALVGWLNYQAWMTDYGPRPGANTVVGTQNSGSAHNMGAANDLSSKIPQASKAESPGPTDNKTATASNATSPTAAPASAEAAAASAATAAAQAGLQGTKWSSLGTVAIEPWFLYYSRQSAQQLERSIQQSLPGSGIASARRSSVTSPAFSTPSKRCKTLWSTTRRNKKDAID